ncbi:MAG: hypothetical protein U1F34_09600 [Gammaproteobacteria bacterium]
MGDPVLRLKPRTIAFSTALRMESATDIRHMLTTEIEHTGLGGFINTGKQLTGAVDAKTGNG